VSAEGEGSAAAGGGRDAAAANAAAEAARVEHSGRRDGRAADGSPLPEGVPWYVDGLRFGCTACGKCCHNHGDGYEHVFSTRSERKAIAAHLGISLRSFERRYCHRVAGRLSFVGQGDACVFLEEGLCAIYPLRPKQCRTFPFWPELLEDRETWERDVAAFCPGAGEGPLHDLNALRRALAEWR
jgi:hypothetical protein